MSDTEARRLSPATVRPILAPLAAVCALLALWLAWSGWQQWQDARGRRALEIARDQVVAGTGQTLRNESKRLQDQLASAPAQAALARGDLTAAAAALLDGWTQVERFDVWPSDLAAVYAGLPKGGYGRLAVAEAALAADAPVARIGKDAAGPRLYIAAPAKAGERRVGVAIATFPMARLGTAASATDIAGDSYLAVRQGSASLIERGDTSRAQSAEALAADVPGTDLRISAGLPPRAHAALGLAAVPALAAAALLTLLAALAYWLLRRGFGLADGRASDEPSLTLAEALVHAPEEKTPVPEIKDAPKPAPVAIDRGIFRAYDIRGVIGSTLDAGVAELVGHAVGSLMQEQGLDDIVIGRDGRLSGPDLIAGLAEGLRKAGRNVVDIGMAPTPVVYFGSYHLRTGCCIAVTGSHNPPDYNGFKIVVGGNTLSGDAIVDLYDRIAGDRLHTAPQPGTLAQRDIAQDYVERIVSDIQTERRLKVVVDAGNGVAGVIGPQVLEAIGADVHPLFCEIDGTFPNHHPDPSDPHNLEDLIRMVERLDADLGIAFDGDGDRLGVVTRDGQNIYPDRLLMLFAADVLERNPGAQIIYDVKCTGHLSGHILRHGGSPLMWKTGHSLIKAKMRETEAELAGEMSGHFFFAERWYGFDDGIYSAARLLEILSAREESPSEVLNALPSGVSTPEIKVDAPDGDPHAFVARFVERAKFEGARLSTIDGLRVDWPDGWGLVRASNTTPVLVLRFDADDAAGLARIQAAFREQLLAVKPDLMLPF